MLIAALRSLLPPRQILFLLRLQPADLNPISKPASVRLAAQPANHVGVGGNGGCGGASGVESQAHPLQQGDAGVAIAVDLDEVLGGPFVAGGVEDCLWRKAEVNGGRIRPTLGRDLAAHVGAGIRSGAGALRGQHGGKMAGFVEEIAGVEQTFGVDSEAAWLQRDSGQEGVVAERREANGKANLPEPVEDKGCRGIQHRR